MIGILIIQVIKFNWENMEKQAKQFGKKEKVLNYASNTYQLTRPSKVGEVMADRKSVV